MNIFSWHLLLAFPLLVAMTHDAAAADEKDLRAVFDAYNSAAKAGNVDKMLSLRTAETEQEIRGQLRKKEDREDFVILGRAQVPDTYDIQHINWAKDGKNADLYALWHLPPMKEIQRTKKADLEARIVFKKEKGVWKMGTVYPLADPAQIKRPKNLTFNEKDAEANVSSASVAGRIVKLEFKPDHTLVMVRVMDEEIAVFLPKKEELQKAGVNFEDYAPWKMREFSGYPHKTDKLKFFATGDNPME
jgi:hypothetical protein